jgi:hypothetical protein
MKKTAIHIIISWIIKICLSCTNTEHSIVACQRTYLSLECREERVINVLNAMYGRLDRFTCSRECLTLSYDPCEKTLSNTKCKANEMPTIKIQNLCNNSSSCKVYIENNIIGTNPCAGIYKYLILNYECIRR